LWPISATQRKNVHILNFWYSKNISQNENSHNVRGLETLTNGTILLWLCDLWPNLTELVSRRVFCN
jgi:hypothetical protein